VLELCCGDGFNAYHFYSLNAKEVVALDYGSEAIAHAKQFHAAENIRYLQEDLDRFSPGGCFDNIIWDAAIEHMRPEEVTAILNKIRGWLKPDGILTGYTLIDEPEVTYHHHHLQFEDPDSLREMLHQVFPHVSVWETTYPSRRNLYFQASIRQPENLEDCPGKTP
jgi:cyclopropane fatty-acyl-phospholipid synthase-like methyltransferase